MHRALVLTLLFVASPVLAGCLGDAPGDALDAQDTDLAETIHPAPELACVNEGAERDCNLEATTKFGPGNEVTIAVNPTDPDNIVAGAKDYRPETAGDCVWDGIYVTKDGGRTWMNQGVPGSPWSLLEDPESFEPSLASQFWCTTDPVVAFGPEGQCYFSFMAYQADPVTASKLGRGIVPQGGLNDWAFNRAAQMVATSYDGCASFDHMSIVSDGTFPVNFHDKQWIEVDQQTGRVHVVWLSFFVPGNQHYYSDDEARSWEGPQVLSTWAGTFAGERTGPLGPAGQGTIVATGPDDHVYVAWNAAGGIWLVTSTDGGESWDEGQLVLDTEDEGMEASYRSGGMPFLAVDRSGGAHHGNVYLAWQDTRDGGDRDILFARSEDGGATWSDPVQVNADPRGHDQFFPAISVSPGGVLDLVWYDRRGDANNTLLDVYYAYSLDGGRTWSDDLRVTEEMSDPTLSRHQNGMIFLGDYIDIDSSEAMAHPVWTDTRHGEADVMTAKIVRPTEAVAAGGA